MKQKTFNKKYRGIKMRKYVPALEREIGKRINQKNDWMEEALDLTEYANEQDEDNDRFLLELLVCLLFALLMCMWTLLGVLI